MVCSKCGASLPDGSQSCPACDSSKFAKGAEPAIAVACLPICSKCGNVLAEGSQACPKCGQPPNAEPVTKQLRAIPVASAERVRLHRARYRPPIVLVILLLLLAALAAWIAYSDSATAQELREDLTGERAQTIVEAQVSVKANSFVYYQFSVPGGSVDVTVSGDFSVTANPGKDKNPDNNIEAYILTDTAFIAWRDGYSTGTFYESGRTSQGTIIAKLPTGAGEYYLVFSNRFSPRTAKTIRTNVLLQYRALLSESLVRLRESIRNWLGLN